MKIAGRLVKRGKKDYGFYPHKSFTGNKHLTIKTNPTLETVREGWYLIEGEIEDEKFVRITKIAPEKSAEKIIQENNKFYIKGNHIDGTQMKIVNVEHTFNDLKEVGLFIQKNIETIESLAHRYDELVRPILKKMKHDFSIAFPSEGQIVLSKSGYYELRLINCLWEGYYVTHFYEYVYGLTMKPEVVTPGFSVTETPTGVSITLRNLKKDFSIEELEPTWFSHIESKHTAWYDWKSKWAPNSKWVFHSTYYNAEGQEWPRKLGDPVFEATHVTHRITYDGVVYKENTIVFDKAELKQVQPPKKEEWDPRDDDPYYDLNN